MGALQCVRALCFASFSTAFRFFPHEYVDVRMVVLVRFAEAPDETWSAATFVGRVVLLATQGERNFQHMKMIWERAGEAAKAGWIFLWLIGVPIPVLLILFLLRGCT